MKKLVYISIIFTLCLASSQASTISEIAALPDGSDATASECIILSTTDLVADTGYKSFQVRDNTRAMTVYGTNFAVDSLLSGYGVGDIIEISGVTARRNGALNLIEGTPGGFAIGGISSCGPLGPQPSAISTGHLSQLDLYESDLVCIQNVSFDTEGFFTVGNDHSIANNAGYIHVATVDLDLGGQPIPTGPLNITGIVLPNTSGNGYVIAPRSLNDIVSIPEPAGLALLGLGGFILRRRNNA